VSSVGAGWLCRASWRRAALISLVLVAGSAVRAAEPEPAPAPVDPVESESDEPPAALSGKPIALRIKTVAPRGSPWGETLSTLSARLKKATGGRVATTVFWEQKSEAALVRQCVKGKTDGIAVSLGALATVVPELEAVELPYLFEGYDAADRAMARATPLIADLLGAHGLVLALRGENGFRHFATVDAPIVSPESLAGRVMRSQVGDEAMWRALGAEPKLLQVADVPASLGSGVVTGYDNTLAFARLAGWADRVSHVTLSAHVYQAAAVVWCPGWFGGLPAELQPRVAARDAKLESSGLKLVRVFNDKLMPEQYAALGKTLRALTDAERLAFRVRLRPLVDAFRAATTDAGRALLDALEGKPAR